ncbi:hypothetical protein Z946_210 [Sulfitobacter noctilucicola]|uniref:Sulfotransferase domain-containing protein n=1 Tax=Sulfitobacter noctilucicola TaxID=1342301 RepID=A0A7W6Q5Z3_9RHOB|nr:hypothetical protein [Sulfitobacter noctilucicola]KIN69844.1 hypothetical protein Z946_210 [Sulfitobacter noctilucicola]MBB4176213.1 hypothetical protein [Sulfitobacter noctilucicola]
MTQTLLHVGYAKTATTYLQRHVFPKSKGINYLGKPFDLSKGRLETFLEKHLGLRCEKVHVFDPFFEHEDIMRVRPPEEIDLGGLAGHLRGILSERDLNVWSHEGYLRSGRKSAPLDRPHAIANLVNVFKAAGSTDIRALVVLRDTKKMLASYAVQFHRDFDYLRIGDLSLEDVAVFRDSDRTDRYAALIWRVWYEYLDYRLMIENLIAGLGRENVYVLRYEEMIADWSLLEDLLRSIHPGIRGHFPALHENTTQDKPYDVSGPIRDYLDSVRDFDVARIFPDNEGSIKEMLYTRTPR